MYNLGSYGLLLFEKLTACRRLTTFQTTFKIPKHIMAKTYYGVRYKNLTKIRNWCFCVGIKKHLWRYFRSAFSFPQNVCFQQQDFSRHFINFSFIYVEDIFRMVTSLHWTCSKTPSNHHADAVIFSFSTTNFLLWKSRFFTVSSYYLFFQIIIHFTRICRCDTFLTIFETTRQHALHLWNQTYTKMTFIKVSC